MAEPHLAASHVVTCTVVGDVLVFLPQLSSRPDSLPNSAASIDVVLGLMCLLTGKRALKAFSNPRVGSLEQRPTITAY
jgi:hypothetical protein